VEALAPDAASLKAARSLTPPGKWISAGSTSDLLFGECKGSGSKPYAVSVDLLDLAAKCTCPSRKFPCKHTLALLLRAAVDVPAVAEVPDWASAWAQKHRTRSAPKPEAQDDPEKAAKAVKDKAARGAKRASKVSTGVSDLEAWLEDLLGEGLLAARERQGSWWDAVSRRLVDAQAPGLAATTELLAHVVRASREDWEERALDLLGELALSVEAWKAREALAPELLASLRWSLGLPLEPTTSFEAPARVLASTTSDAKVSERLTWVELLGPEHQGSQLLLRSYAYRGGFEFEPQVGHEAMATFEQACPGATAAKATWSSSTSPASSPTGTSVSEALDAHAALLGRDPWVRVSPVSVLGVLSPLPWRVTDADGTSLTVASGGADLWSLLAGSGGAPTVIQGLYDGFELVLGGQW
jgi:hypothetical protein